MGGTQTYNPDVMENAAANLQECVVAAGKVADYASLHCSLDGAFGFLLQPLQPIHNGARDAVMRNLNGLGECLATTRQSVLDTIAERVATEAEICKCCDDLQAQLDAIAAGSTPGGTGGSVPGGGGGSMPGGGGGSPAPPAPAVPTPEPPTLEEPEVPQPTLPEPVDPTGPTDSVPSEPVGPTEPTDSVPSEPVDPTEPTPSDPSEPSDPTEPTPSDDPEKPVDGDEDHDGNGSGAHEHPVGCRCSACDVHPVGCQCTLCLGENVQHGCPPSCHHCHAGTAHVPEWVAHCGLPDEVRAREGDGAAVHEHRWANREPIVVVRPSESGGSISFDIKIDPDDVQPRFQAMPGSLGFSIDSIVTAAYSRPERVAL